MLTVISKLLILIVWIDAIITISHVTTSAKRRETRDLRKRLKMHLVPRFSVFTKALFKKSRVNIQILKIRAKIKLKSSRIFKTYRAEKML